MPDSDACQIRCRDLTVRFGGDRPAVDGVNLTATAGQILSLIGPSGCGKTTLLRCLAGLQRLTSGGLDTVPPVSGTRGEIAFVFQQPALLPWRTALQNVTLPLELLPRENRGDNPRRDWTGRAREMLERVELTDAADRFPRELSGGMRMRVSLARALVTEPKILLLDEPFAALDEMLRTQLGELLTDLWQKRRFTAVLVTHNVPEAIALSDRIAVMRSGHVGEVIDNPLPRDSNQRQPSSHAFADFYGHVGAALRGATDVAPEPYAS